MKVYFLFPGSSEIEALDNWVRTISRWCKSYDVTLERQPCEEMREASAVVLLTESRTYPRPRIDRDIVSLRAMGVRFAVLHNHDAPGVPTPNDYPSFCWTQRAFWNLERWQPFLLRQPVLPRILQAKQRHLHIGTFGHCEPKKCTLEMAQWCRQRGLPFTAFCPEPLAKQYGTYHEMIREEGGHVIVHPWLEHIEHLGRMMDEISHFLFVLPPSKAGSGGSPTSPRYAAAFGRPVIVIDDENTFAKDSYNVYGSLDELGRGDWEETLLAMAPPRCDWTPEEYVQSMATITNDWWTKYAVSRV